MVNRPKYDVGTWFKPLTSNEVYEIVDIMRSTDTFRYMLKRHWPFCTGLPYGVLEKDLPKYFITNRTAQILYGKARR